MQETNLKYSKSPHTKNSHPGKDILEEQDEWVNKWIHKQYTDMLYKAVLLLLKCRNVWGLQDQILEKDKNGEGELRVIAPNNKKEN